MNDEIEKQSLRSQYRSSKDSTMEGSFSSVIDHNQQAKFPKALRGIFQKRGLEDRLVDENIVMKHRDSMAGIKSMNDLDAIEEPNMNSMEGSFSSVINDEQQPKFSKALRGMFQKKTLEDRLVEKDIVMKHRDSMNMIKSLNDLEVNEKSFSNDVLLQSISGNDSLAIKHRSSLDLIKNGGGTIL
mmetsp:Transcript_42073/g.59093  ORF Transcript_42073/g.59093 Transcript_42073/m.59093 type:complete len:185 (-) Transcript_42073:209-763(-)